MTTLFYLPSSRPAFPFHNHGVKSETSIIMKSFSCLLLPQLFLSTMALAFQPASLYQPGMVVNQFRRILNLAAFDEAVDFARHCLLCFTGCRQIMVAKLSIDHATGIPNHVPKEERVWKWFGSGGLYWIGKGPCVPGNGPLGGAQYLFTAKATIMCRDGPIVRPNPRLT